MLTVTTIINTCFPNVWHQNKLFISITGVTFSRPQDLLDIKLMDRQSTKEATTLTNIKKLTLTQMHRSVLSNHIY